ncbi:ABC transporter permease [Ulvibacterium sp.]|uniref:ABC transporter permease n=1 Tax=Ulvibacterium sp. TaxID=2665914 RepID=UPI003CC6CC49
MFKNHLKIAWRNLLRNRSFSTLNIVGLSIGLAITGLIAIWIDFELGVSQFHENKDRIYLVYNQYPVDGEIWTWEDTPKIMAPTIKKDFPEVERVSRYNHDNTYLFSVGSKRIKATGTTVDPDFLYIFSFPLIKGVPETVLEGVNSIVITESFAKQLFGNEEPMGRVIKLNDRDVFAVTGVLKDLPKNSLFDYQFLLPWKYLEQQYGVDEIWGNNSIATFLLLQKGVDYTLFSDKIRNLRENYDKGDPETVTYLYPFSRKYLYGSFENGIEKGGYITVIRLFGIIGLIVLIIACINFMNLCTAQSEKRSKEVGIRKVVGAQRRALIVQFIGESILITCFSAILALILVVLTLPRFNRLVNRDLKIDYGNPLFWLVILGIVVFTGLLAGSYPSLYLSSFRPASVLKGTFRKVNTLLNPRKVLVVTQFAVAIVLITATIIVKKQLIHVQNRQTGYQKENLIYTAMEGRMDENYNLIKQDLISSGTATAVTRTMSPITENWSNSWGMNWPGKDPDDHVLIFRFSADDDFIETFGLDLVKGRAFNHSEFPTDSTAMIINETAVEHMGFKEPIGQVIKDMGEEWHVIGVVKDFVMTSPFQKIEPMIIHGKWGRNFIDIRLNSNRSIAQNLEQAEAIFNKHNPEYPFNYTFVEDEYGRKFASQKRTETLASLFTTLTIFISCLGLFGLASYMAENRVKEIGIRKVLGASIGSITSLLSKDFLKLVMVSIVIAVPISWYFMSKWLEDFAYRITITWWAFAVSGILALSIAMVTISFQAIKAANTNPVKSLRTE